DAVTINTHDNTAQNDGTLLSEQADIAISTAKLNNTGIIHSTQTAKIAAKQAIENRGSVYGGVLQVNTGKLDNTGQLIQTGTGKLDITTDTLINTDKAVIGQSLYGQTSIPAPSTPSSDQSAGSISSEPTDNTASNPQPPALSDSGANTQTKPVPTARGHITATNSIHNTGSQALITATGDIGISADKTSNTKQASIDVQSLNTNTLVNTDSKIALDEINWQLTRFDNSQGSITARNGMVIDSGSDMINTGGQLSAADTVALSAVGVLDNTQGVITSGGDLTVASSDVVNHKGLIASNKGATLTTTNTLDNTQGKILSSHSITIDTKDFTNKGEVLAKTVLVQAQTDIHHAEDDILTADNLSLATKGNITNSDKLVASSEITLQAANIDNANIAIVSAPKASIHADNTITNLGLIHANDLAIDANTVKNLGARIYGGEVAITADAVLNQGGDKGAVIAAQKDLTLAVNTLTNTHGDSIHQTATDNAWILSQGTLSIHGKDGKDSKANELTNLGSRIESAGDMLLSAKNINNTNAKFASTIQKVAGSEQYKEYIIPEHSSTKIDMASLEWRPWSRANYLTYKGAGDLSTNLDNLGSAPIASVYSCQNDNEDSCGISYAPDSAVWQHFGIQAPSPMPVIEKVLEEPKLPENETEESCTKADASNTACIAYNKALAEYSKALKPLIDWEEANKPQLDALDAAISDYNAKFGNPQFKNFTIFKVTEHQEQSVVTASAPAQIISGGNLDFDADTIINDKSQIIAGGKIVFDSDSLKNIDAKGEHHTIENGTAQYTRSRWRGGFKRYHQRDWAGVAPFATTLKKSITLPVTAWQENASSDTLADYGQTKPNTGHVAIDVNLGNLPNTDVVNTAPISLPNSALYIINADDPNLPLVQTDPAFTDYKQWLSSDYMLKALQSDPNHIHKRLYDGFAEQKIIQDAYYQLTGRHINTDYQNQEVAYQALMDNGITAAKAFGYTLGTALTAEQMA
ncbi:hypothetical protein, partial [Moraxella porci]|uniref:hypothetical protein n=1 Tax=Moraxella porci TaxID=1288392 RepID=UPI00244C6265